MKDSVFIQQQVQKGIITKEKAALELFTLSNDQLNWKQNESSWSIAHCLEHLIISDGLRINIIEKKIMTDFRHSSWEKLNPLKNFWGPVLTTQTQEKVKKKIKAPRLFLPAADFSSHDILLRFEHHHDKVFRIISHCIEADIDQVHVTSPVSGWVTYSLRNAIAIITGHERRHINQAIRIKAQTGFPV